MTDESGRQKKTGSNSISIIVAIIVAMLAFLGYRALKPKLGPAPTAATPAAAPAASTLAPTIGLTNGWSEKGPTGVWSAGAQATLDVPVSDATEDVPVAIALETYIPTPSYVQHVRVSSGSTSLADWTFNSKSAGGGRFLTAPKALVKNGVLTLKFALPDATSPKEQKQSSDPRKLAIFVHSIAVMKTSLKPGDNVNIGPVDSSPYLTSGWSALEPTGVWSGSNNAVLTLPVTADGKPLSVSLKINSFIPRAGYIQHIKVAAGGKTIANWVFGAKSAGGLKTLQIPNDAVHDGLLTLDFSLPDATSPAEQKVSGDPRKLAMFIQSISIGR